MAVEDADDLAGFFDADDFAVTATLTGGGTVEGIFDAEYYAALDGIAGVAVESSQPAFTAPTSDLSGVGQGDTLTIDGATYEVVEVKPDGTGVTTLRLLKQ